MKNVLIALFFTVQYSLGCPSCVGRIESDGPAYFSREFDKASSKDKALSHEKNEKLRRWAQEEENQEVVDDMATPEQP